MALGVAAGVLVGGELAGGAGVLADIVGVGVGGGVAVGVGRPAALGAGLPEMAADGDVVAAGGLGAVTLIRVWIESI